MILAFRKSTTAAGILVLICLLLVGSAHTAAGANDKWLGEDKFRHIALSAFISVFSYKVSRFHFNFSENKSVNCAVGVTLSLGSLKELYDSKHPDQTASFKDIAADLLGIGLGIFIATR
ncbi:MAG: hypothetical protein CO189_12410 [candidate division Zixibacteria bacterium CG_4_9_14_3_um_filter_46_8]|nr:MAG: hypothetical protein CO189_12410 [candidate division Zixibacteria bacterium CG_4_9_14_3_um_filter_46_8]